MTRLSCRKGVFEHGKDNIYLIMTRRVNREGTLSPFPSKSFEKMAHQRTTTVKQSEEKPHPYKIYSTRSQSWPKI